MTELEHNQLESLNYILDNAALTPIFQPIVSLQESRIYGYEALIRGPSDSILHSPINLFDTASRHGRLAELDLLCREIAIRRYGELGLEARLFLNTIPAALLDPDYPYGLTLQFLEQSGIPAEQVVIELTEQYPIDDYELMREATRHYRDMGFSIAIDDLGAGYAGLRTWSELRPEFVKLDRHFMQNIHNDAQKEHFVQSMMDIAQGIECQVIGEGVEVRSEYLTAQSMQMHFVQGYYFARPSAQPSATVDPALFAKRRPLRAHFTGRPRNDSLVRTLLNPMTPVQTHDSADDVSERFQAALACIALPVVDTQNRVAGMVWRNDFMTLYASRYGRDLHGRKPIHLFMDKQPVITDVNQPLKTLSQRITSLDASQQHSVFIITEDGHYSGVGSLIDLLRHITDMQINMARHANPLTGLPGNVPISEQLNIAVTQNLDITVCYIDLDNFKPYNDIYGYARGDTVIRTTADILAREVDTQCDFIGHVGGDDFIVIFESPDWEARCHRIMRALTAAHADLYLPGHLEKGGMQAIDRHGREVFYSLLTLSIGALSTKDFGTINDREWLAEQASKAKAISKCSPGNSLYKLRPEDVTAPRYSDIA